MKKRIAWLLLLLCLVSCEKTIPDREVPQTDAPMPEAVLTDPVPQTAPPEDVQQREEALSDPQIPPQDGNGDDGIDNPVQTVVQPESSFTPACFLIDLFGDMEKDPEDGYYLVEEDIGEIEYSCMITMDLPDSWQISVSTAQDIPRADAGIYSTKRMEFYTFLYRTPETDREEMDWTDHTTPTGQSYRYWEETGSSIDRCDVIWHHCEYPVRVGQELFWFHIYFLTFSNDPAGYFEEYIQPAIDSAVIQVDQ